jgi:hypothetical protein
VKSPGVFTLGSANGEPAALSRRVGKVVAYPPLCDMSDLQRREFHEALIESGGGDGDSRAATLAAIGPCRPHRSGPDISSWAGCLRWRQPL